VAVPGAVGDPQYASSVRPVIGITCYVEHATWGAWERRAALLPYPYVERLREAGAYPVVLPPDPEAGTDLLGRLDGLVLAGGADVDPERYGAPVHPATITRPERDAGEMAMLAAALELDLPVLGVCRGAEVLAVYYGGTLHQHLPDLLGSERHLPGAGVYGHHGARFLPGSMIAKLYGEHTEINSYHHQAIADPGGLAVTGWSDDEVVEAVEDPAHRFVLGVQWHPEQAGDVRPFAALVDAARDRR
jgi:putative glutamine amidotransferase